LPIHHSLVLGSMSMRPSRTQVRHITCRPLKRVNPTNFAADLEAGLRLIQDYNDTEELALKYREMTQSITEQHAPIRKVKLKGTDIKAWYDDEIHDARKERRRRERKFRKTGLEVHRQCFTEQREKVVQLIKQKKRHFFQEKFSNANASESFHLINSLLHGVPKHSLPANKTDEELCEDFMAFFQNKIAMIRAEIDSHPLQLVQTMRRPIPATLLSCFRMHTEAEVIELIKCSATKSCSLDSIPTALLKHEEVLPSAVPALTKIINTSLSTGHVPSCFKEAVISPGLKKPGLDANELKNYRPISNICFPAKIMEKVVAKQLVQHLKQNGIFDPLQSAYQKGKSCETVLIKIKNDVDLMLSEGRAALIVLLDLSAAFDTLDHEMLLHRLQDIGVTDMALTWMRSYLQGRKQCVKINCSLSLSLSPF